MGGSQLDGRICDQTSEAMQQTRRQLSYKTMFEDTQASCQWQMPTRHVVVASLIEDVEETRINLY